MLADLRMRDAVNAAPGVARSFHPIMLLRIVTCHLPHLRLWVTAVSCMGCSEMCFDYSESARSTLST